MTCDHDLLDRIRPFLCERPGFSERKMFGSICFMLNGNMCVGTWKGGLVVRLDREKHDDTQSEPHTRPFDVTGRVMKGWALIEPAGIESNKALEAWVERAAEYVTTLPKKAKS